ncbi:hypothetical protein PENSPDRAFT_749991 [Peniophora sp. CONT]|nr:hypothetical protein PENSPDRAFT_749991 [Peniophora sp. CONT]
MSTDPDCDPWASLTRTRLAALHTNASHPTRADLESEIYRIQTALHSFLELLNQPPHTPPLLSLPDETIVEILLYVRDAGVRDRNGLCENPDHRNMAVWFSFSHVCRRMRDIALNTPALWTDVSDLHGNRLLATFLPRSQCMALSLRLRCITQKSLDRDDLGRISHLRATLTEEGNFLLPRVPLLETLYVDTSSISTLLHGEFLPAPSSIPPHLYSMHLIMRPYPWECSIYDGLTNLVLSTATIRLWFTLVQVQNLFARMNRVETVVIRDIDISQTGTDLHVELPSRLRSMYLEYSLWNARQEVVLPLCICPRLGTRLSICLKTDFRPPVIRDTLYQLVFDEAAGQYPSKLRVQIIPDGKLWYGALSYWYTSAVHPHTVPDFKIQFQVIYLPFIWYKFLLEVQQRHIDNLSFYSDYPLSLSDNLPSREFAALLLTHSLVHTVHSTPHAFACLVSSASLPLNADDAFENQLGSLQTLHLRADPLDDTSKALEFLGVIARWLRAREDVGLAKVEVHVDERLKEVLGGIAVEELAG